MTSPLTRCTQTNSQLFLRTSTRPTVAVHPYTTVFKRSYHESGKQSDHQPAGNDIGPTEIVGGLVALGAILGAGRSLYKYDDNNLFEMVAEATLGAIEGAILLPLAVITSPIVVPVFIAKKIIRKFQ